MMTEYDTTRPDLRDLRCPVCHQIGSVMLLTDPKLMLRQFITARGTVYIHIGCLDTIVKEWVDKYGRGEW
jgi:hypothetical protein